MTKRKGRLPRRGKSFRGNSQRARPIRAVDFFCGVGGLTHGLAKGGVKVVAGVDLDEACRYPYEANNEAKFVLKDITKVSGGEVKRLLGKQPGLTLLAGCAPCQPFSTYSQSARKKKAHPDWELLSAFGRLIRMVKPDLVTMENVPELAGHPIFGKFLASLRGYHVDFKVVECDAIGIPQTRSRLVLVASRRGPIELTLPKKWRPTTVRSAIHGLPTIRAGEADAKDPLHVSSKLSEMNLKRIRHSKPGGTWRDWPLSLRSPCHQKKSGRTYSSVYGRMSWDQPAPTMTTQCFGFGNGRFGHPEQDRAISLREAALLQSFPRNYAFVPKDGPVNMKVLGRLIGNAVPVALGRLIADTLIAHTRDLKRQRRSVTRT